MRLRFEARQIVESTIPVPASFPQMLVEEMRDLPNGVLGFRRVDVAQILGMRLAFEDLQHGLDAGLAQLAMHPHRIAEQEVARAGCEDRGRAAAHVAVARRQERLLQYGSFRIERS